MVDKDPKTRGKEPGGQQWLVESGKACLKAAIDILIRGEGSMGKVNFDIMDIPRLSIYTLVV